MHDPIEIGHIEPLKTEPPPQRTCHFERNGRSREPTPNRQVFLPPPGHATHDHAAEQIEYRQHERLVRLR